jgi:hypothetical protein
MDNSLSNDINIQPSNNNHDKVSPLQRFGNPSRTEEVAVIIDKMPTKFGIIVTSIVIGLVILLLLFGWLIKYPDVLRGQITINARQSPIKFVAATAGNLILLHNNAGEKIKQGEYIALIKNSAKLKDVKLLDSLLSQINIHEVNYEANRHFFPENIEVGELNNKYFVFLNALYQFLDYSIQQPFEKQKGTNKKMLATQQKLMNQLHNDYQREKQKYTTTLSLYKKSAVLFADSVISKADFEKAIISTLSSEQEFKSVDKQITNTDYQISDAVNKLQLLAIQKLEKERELAINLFNTYYELQDNIKQWEHKYVFVSPINGQIDFLSFLKTDDYVQTGQELFKIIPDEIEMIGQVLLPEQGSGKVIDGQDVIIKLDNYPYTQFGSIKGNVKNISLATNQQALSNAQNKVNSYLVVVTLPNGLSTNYGTTLNFHFEAKGTAEIITDNRRLIERLFDNLRYKLK